MQNALEGAIKPLFDGSYGKKLVCKLFNHIYWNGSSPGVVPLPVSNIGLRLFHHLPLPQEHLRLQLDFTSSSCGNVCQEFKHSRKCPKDSIYTACTFLREHLDYLSQPHCKASNKSLCKGRISIQPLGRSVFGCLCTENILATPIVSPGCRTYWAIGILEYYTGKGETMVFSRPKCPL